MTSASVPAARPEPHREAQPGQPGDVQPALDHLFEEWREQEQHVDLSDLRWTDILVFATFWVLFGVVFLQFYTRYILNDSLGWTEEIARYLLVAVVFIGSITAMRKGTHIAVEALLVYLPKEGKHWILVAVDGLVALFCYGMAWYGYVLGERANQYMVSIDIPKSYMYWMVALAILGMAVHATIRFVRRLRRREADQAHTLVLD
ncbi:TRAP transporter small permease [Salinarimonas soli]|uniref:TRAP transporter small permease protein n=1 Tax=Salinarimonas soli TaxID=1638099 RepID=A0A5B2VEL8_9HYPH|nr:TRAP transporter small permease [Salinarimonas soli]KAA2237265.1 TRAP transporter small permease [Salinarimonas soli]